MHRGALAAALEHRRECVRQAVFATALSTGAAVLFAVLAPRLLAPLAITAVICALAAALLRESYLELLERLATDADAYSVPAVRRFGERIVDLRERRRLAQLIDDLVDHGGGSLTLGVAERLTTHRAEFREIARALANPLNTPRPTIVASCRRLLIRAAESPLYNERLPDEELAALVRQIHIGIADR